MEEDGLALLVTSSTQSARAVPAVVRHGSRRWVVPAGTRLTFGRSATSDIRIGTGPVDDYVSRTAGSLTALPDGLLVRNTSQTQTIVLFAIPGPETAIRPGAAVGTMPHRRLQLVVPGRFGRRYVLHLDVHPQFSAPLRSLPVPAPREPVTHGAPEHITPRERTMLAALCRPLLVEAGAEPASYREIAEQVGSTPHSVRTCLDRLRARLSDVDGIPGLRADEDVDGADRPVHYVGALARWAIDAGVVPSR